MKFAAITALEQHLQTVFGGPPLDIQFERPPETMKGDITVNGFRLAGVLRRPPAAVAAAAVECLRRHPDVESVEAVKAFINLVLRPQAVFRDTVCDEAGLLDDAGLPPAERRRLLIEFSAPNTNKPQHLGHVRNNTLGQAMVAIQRRVGHTVFPINLVNDRGIHICKSMLAYQRFGGRGTPEATATKGDHFVGDYYVKFDAEFRRQLGELRTARPDLAGQSDDELFLETEIGRAAQAMLVAWEGNDPAVRALWRTMNRWVLEGFAQTYARMGVEFDRTYYESETFALGKDLILEHLAAGTFERRPDGAVFIDLEKEGAGKKVVLRSDGTSVYVTQDIGTTILKQNDFRPDQQVWIVGDEQIHHFKVLFAILRRMGYPWAGQLYHMAYGMVNLPSGRMKSREGTVVDADDLFDEMERLARAATLERAEGGAPDDLDRRARVIGMAALKYMLLKVNPKTTILFDPEASLKFEGDTGPYVLYAYARVSSMLRKADPGLLAQPVDWTVLGAPEEKEIALRCAEYGRVLRRAAREFDTSALATYLLDLAKAFSRFYRELSVLSAPTPALCRARLELSRRVQRILQDGLAALTIETLESM
ncbi:MAG: Arginine--tRNA ligase [Lentisphaerae bacterium ADurb.BinA184]|nr:MAG: Arginine--tRNA ligase [Lentisphaerae bacterium ADurb.BinA184]